MDRRGFINTAAAAVSGLMLLKPQTAFTYQANSAVGLALLGCGSRGTTVATSFAKNTNTRIVALADLFPDKLETAKAYFNQLASSLGYAGIDQRRLFRGYRAFEEVAVADGVDAVQISTPCWFHTEHLDAVIRAGKHAYCEKPLGVDVEQTRQALEIGNRAQGRVSVEVGFQIRSAPPFVEMVRRIQSGALGEIACISANYDAAALTYPDRPAMSADELRLRNWEWDLALSGDIIVEQNIHVVDICNWILGTHPLKAIGTGGRKVISHFGNTWDNYQVTYTYPKDIRVNLFATQFGERNWFGVSERVFGSEGVAELPYAGPMRIVGKNARTLPDEKLAETGSQSGSFAVNGALSNNLADADREKERSFIESIVSGKFHNQVAAGVETARSAMLGRMAARQGREVTWDELLSHGEEYTMDINMQQFQ
jgi:myo-inositol 2-dehydrogenase/D-chiro-inositol 1-dehydrogenase